MKPGGGKRRIAADLFNGGFRVLITGPHGFERTVMLVIDDGPAVIAKRVTERQPEFDGPTFPSSPVIPL
jgi:hypothetical protein